jgi:hypothetical protein
LGLERLDLRCGGGVPQGGEAVHKHDLVLTAVVGFAEHQINPLLIVFCSSEDQGERGLRRPGLTGDKQRMPVMS